jgi:hypothetical protein
VSAPVQLDLFAPRPVMSARERFAALLSERANVAARCGTGSDLDRDINARFAAEMRPLLVAAKAKKIPAEDKECIAIAYVKTQDAYNEAFARYKTEVDAAYEARKIDLKAIDDRLSDLAESAELRVGTELVSYYRSYVSTYATQGNGCVSYARNAAEMTAQQPRFYGVDARVAPVEFEKKDPPVRFGTSRGIFYFEVSIQVESSLDAEIIRRRPGPTLRDELKMALKIGINPRVLNPFLPHGIEEKLGLDYLGNDLPTYVATQRST